jgi:hypothetical protein
MPLTWSELDAMGEDVMTVLQLPYTVAVSELPGITLHLFNRDGSPRAEVHVQRRGDETYDSVRRDFAREVQTTLRTCPLCGTEAAIQRRDPVANWLSVECPTCVHEFVIEQELFTSLRRARSSDDQAVLSDTALVSGAIRDNPEVVELQEASFRHLLEQRRRQERREAD